MKRSQEPVQISLFQLDNYGPWTVTPEPRRETDIQALQARLFADLADFLGGYDGYAFYDRFDNMVGVTNGIDASSHERFQERVRNRYPVTVSVGIGTGPTPVSALDVATEELQRAGSAQDAGRTEILSVGGTNDEPGELTVAHFDIVDVTGQFTDAESAGDTTLAVRRAAVALRSYLRREHDSLTHFVGGDNIISVCPPLETDAFADTRDHIESTTGIDLQVGVGRGRTAHEAGYDAKLALETCRESGDRVVIRGAAAVEER